MSKKGRDTDFANLPEHIGIIMDGNGRWATKRFLTRNAGHKAGAETLRRLTEKMNGQGFKRLTAFVLSTENWARPAEEVNGLMTLLNEYIQRYIDEAASNSMRLNVIGDINRLEPELRRKIRYLTEITENHGGLMVTLAINYGGRDDIIRAVRAACLETAEKSLSADVITEEFFAGLLDTAGLPDPDLIIRTSGELRLSNFMLWQAAYAELYSCPKLWPDFTYDDLLTAVTEFQQRDRKYGK